MQLSIFCSEAKVCTLLTSPAPALLRVTKLNYIEHIETDKLVEEESISFEAKVLERSGIRVESCVSISLHEIPVDASLGATTKETETALFTVVNDLAQDKSQKN